MSFTLPDKGEGANDVQSILFQEYLDVIIAAIAGTDFVLSGCAVTAQGSPDMTVAVAVGTVMTNKVPKAVAAGNVTITAAHATLPRLDLVVVDSTGAKAARAGTAAANPKPPARTANDVVLAVVYVPATDTTIGANQITDLRVINSFSPRVLEAGADHVISSTTGTEVTGLKMPLEPGTYAFKYSLLVRSATGTVGPMLGVNFDGTATVNMIFRFADATTVITAEVHSMDNVGILGAGFISGMAHNAFSTTAPNMGTTVGVAATAADIPCFIEGVLVVTAAGELELWHSSETASSTSVMAKSSLVVQRIA